jgi:hypothetical protein
MAATMMDVREYKHRSSKLWIWLIWLSAMVRRVLLGTNHAKAASHARFKAPLM